MNEYPIEQTCQDSHLLQILGRPSEIIKALIGKGLVQ